MSASPARVRGWRKAMRDVFQAFLAVIAAGGTTVLIDSFLDSVPATWSIPIGIAYKILFVYVQNYLETAGKIPVMLPTPGMVPSTGALAGQKTVGTVETTVEQLGGAVGEITGTVEGLEGELLAEVRDVDRGDSE